MSKLIRNSTAELKNIYNGDELDKKATIGNFPIVQKEGIHNANFNYGEFAIIKSQAGLLKRI